MSEFSFTDIQDWLAIAYNQHAPIQRAIYYSLFFDCEKDGDKFNRAVAYFEEYMKDKMSWVKP